MPADFEHLDEYAQTRGPAYRELTFEDICVRHMGKAQRTKLRKLFSFRFRRHEKYNLPDERIDAIERHLQKRARQLILL
jgi:hypothetical protein